MRPPKICWLYLFVCLVAVAFTVPAAIAQSTSPQTKAPIVKPPTAPKQWTGRMKQLRAEAATKGYNPNIWIDNDEIVVAERVGAETVTYVSNIYKYYVAYKLIAVQEEQQRKAREAIQKKPS
jgi:hypothetical protein